MLMKDSCVYIVVDKSMSHNFAKFAILTLPLARSPLKNTVGL